MAKAKFDSAKIKKTLAAHAEKIGFGAALVLMGVLLYSALQIQPYKQTPEQAEATSPDDLKRLVGTVRGKIEGEDNKKPPRFDMAKDGVLLPGEEPIKVIERLLLTNVSPAIFNGIEWNKPLFDTKQRRREPEMLALRGLRAAFYNAPINVLLPGEPANGQKHQAYGEEWLTVTGVVPLEDQTLEFTKAFQNALDTTTNAAPVYTLYQIQRAEIDRNNLETPITWDAIQPVDLKFFITDEMAKWGGVGNEYVKGDFARAPLTQPLPILSNGDYGDWAAHAPEIPSAAAAAGDAPAPAGAAPAAGAQPPANGNLFGGAVAPPPAQPGVINVNPAIINLNPQGANAAPKAAPPYLLFRFLDFKIEPRKFYRYRVKLIVANPNYNLDKAHLDKPEFALGETRETPWSEPSPPVGVPVLEHYFGGGVPTVNGETEPLANLGIKIWYPRLGADAYFEFDKKFRGAMLNDAAASVTYSVPAEKRGDKAAVPLLSNALLADFAWETGLAKLRGPAQGAGLEPRPCMRPSEMLVMTPRGEMLILTELGDMPLRDEMKAVGAGAGPAPAGGAGVAVPGVPAAAGPGAAIPGAAPPGAAPAAPKKKSIFDL